jgi:ABC-type oligopeptide transport system substrate-binding subunit
MLTITPEMLDRIEAIRQAMTAAIKSSTLPDEWTIELRQAINQAIDTNVAAALKAAGTSTSSNSIITPTIQF